MSRQNAQQAVLDALPMLIVVIPFGMLFGLSASELGFSLAIVLSFSGGTFAAASQFAAIQLMVENAPAIVIIATALAVNLRMVMYSATLAPHFKDASLKKRLFASYLLVDQNFALAAIKYENSTRTSSEKILYFSVLGACLWLFWMSGVFIGATIGQHIPQNVGLDFSMPIMFIALFSVALKTPAHAATACTSCVIALALHAVPYNLGLLIAAFIAMVVGAEIERRAKSKTP